MIYPNKVVRYSQSTLALFPAILKELSKSEATPSTLSRVCKVGSTADLIEALDMLYALGEVDMTADGKKVRYVGRNRF